jgi:plasmid stabilization system protein ParE
MKARKAGASKATYLVNIAARAERDLALLFREIDAGNSSAALKWYKGLKEAILSLENLPYRCPVIPEKSQLRHLLYGRKPHVYRVIYRLLEKEKRVEVLHIRHGARRELAAADLGWEMPQTPHSA